jgi:superfamily I DNA and/or RNA helicase
MDIVFLQYKKQQRKMQYEFERNGFKEIPVLTIDQCQGQEADHVLLTLVQKPTRFLNKNRLNVALSRVRKRLYFVADKEQLRVASRNSSWDCAAIATDLLEMAGDNIDRFDYY